MRQYLSYIKQYRRLLILPALVVLFCLSPLAPGECFGMEMPDAELSAACIASPPQAESDLIASEGEEQEIPGRDIPSIASTADAQPPVTFSSAADPVEITKVVCPYSDIVVVAEAGRAEEMLMQRYSSDPLFSMATASVKGSSRPLFLTIQYDFDSLDVTKTGLTRLYGTVTPPEGYSLTPELSRVSLPVFLYDPAAPCEIPIATVEKVSPAQVVMPQSWSREDLLNEERFDDTIYYILEDGTTWNAKASWDFDQVSFGTPGSYKAIARPQLPEGILFPENLPDSSCDVIIQKDGVFELGPPEFRNLHMLSSWAKETPDLDLMRCFYAIGDGDWQEDTGRELIKISAFNPQYLQIIFAEDVFFETPYYFQLCYDGEYSNILKVYFSENQLHYQFYDGDRDGGDRDDQTPPNINQPPPNHGSGDSNHSGETQPTPPESNPSQTPDSGEMQQPEASPSGDDNGGSLSGNGNSGFFSHAGSGSGYVADGPGYDPKAAQNPDTAPETGDPTPATDPLESRLNDPKPDTNDRQAAADHGLEARNELSPVLVAEEDTADYMVLSGIRLNKYRERNPGRPFIISKHQIQLEIPLESEEFSSMTDQSFLRADLVALSENTIQLGLTLGEAALSVIPELTLTMPYQQVNSDALLQVLNSEGAVIAEAKDAGDSRITFTVTQTGVFTIRETAEKSAFSGSDTPGGSQQPNQGALDAFAGQSARGGGLQTGHRLITGSSGMTIAALMVLTAIFAILPPFAPWLFRLMEQWSGRKGGGKP